jgi:hypothetical protein
VRKILPRLLPLLLLAIACLYTYRLDVAQSHTYAAAGIGSLKATTKNGFIHVAASADTVVTVVESTYAYGKDRADAEKAIPSIVYSDTLVGTALMIAESIPGGSRPYGASFTITAPEGISLSLATTNGDVTVQTMVGGVNVTTTNGAIVLIGTAGTASVSTTNGRLDAKVHRGAFYGATTNGAIECDLAELGPTEDVVLATTNGEVKVWLPADVSAVIDATNTNGNIAVYDFTATYDTQTQNHISARIGSGASRITINTTNADVVIRRRSS